ncbi:DNA topoisomerase IV subunit A [Anoxybacillus rupiensis]|uniref:DNA topoisomerase 4 subunit A n=1 Tax=Anoxybacteroides rupiense TaxID=311460 RepID=A0ABD5IX81_9BACL|nr:MULTISPECIES: DNA topoisomerase IV subunit A [Anoxybacillus]MBS2772602.1 DNA topoisomerase IV subunit A [Anoxybacillus rupiensis]MDE8564116.1 DNA topoisomerase IV subunit A [Anoxybacillus rupiensis]MED5052264.1 DNA topoisomerase IV subunit A [Anoxybacillus rupiensis]QHC04023.1 DNA topoisomerase IV subunit A [Anoxybacillus sp. PDR2]
MTERLLDLPLEDVLGDRFGRYSKYIIQERALPDARDGLKPVQRRILYAMYVDGNTADKGFRKAAKTVGNVIGNFHPHGDSSVYEAMVRMSQDWKLRNILIEMHGNNGSIDGDPPAAMRYTEARLSAIAVELLRDIEKQTVEFVPNFDDTSEEPVVLPAMFPNLLVNGSTGISAGYATEIPPHHLGEVIDAVIMRIDKPNCTVDEIMTVLHGPDFPTGGIIQGREGIKKAYETGKGKIMIRGTATIEAAKGGKQQIIITELPYEVNKANLVKKMDELRFDRKLDGIADVRDETDRTGLRIVVELKKEADAEGILNYLYKNTDLQVPYNFNMVAIHNRRPKLLSLLELLDAYIEHQKEVVTNRSRYELKKAHDRQHIVEGLMKALSILDEIIATIRASKDKREAKDRLMAQYAFTEAQAEAIVSLQLYRLTNTDITALKQEAEELEKKISELSAILASEKKLLSVIKAELRKLKKTYADERRTAIQEEIEEIKINLEVMIPAEDVIVTVTKEGYVKRTSLRSYTASNGQDFGMKESDRLLAQFEMNTTDVLLLFTRQGSYIYCPVHELPDIRWKELGQHISHMVPLDREDELVAAVSVQDFDQPHDLMFVTKQGMVKRTPIQQYKVQRYGRPLVALNLKEHDEVVHVYMTDGHQDLFLVTHQGYGLWFSEEEVNPVGVRAAGVKGIQLKENDFVVAAQPIFSPEQAKIVIATQRGAVKKMGLGEFEKSSRAKRGLVMIRELKTNPHRIAAAAIVESDPSQMVVRTEKGEIEVIDLSQLKLVDRYNSGKFVVDHEEAGDVKEMWLTDFHHGS